VITINKKDLKIVTSPKMFIDSNFEIIDEDGLLSQRLFGPLKSWHCACGKLSSKTLYADITCDKCGVICGPNELRYKTFCKIILPFPIYKNTMYFKNILRKIVGKMEKHLLDPLQSDLSITKTNYLQIDSKVKIVNTYQYQTCLPFKITGLYSLYLALSIGWEILHNYKCKEALQCFDNELLVTPPGIRFVNIKPIDNLKQLIQHPSNKYYSTILRLVNFDWQQIGDTKQNEEKLIKFIDSHIGDIDPIEIEELKFYDQVVVKHQYYVNLIYTEVIKSLSGKDGSIRYDFLGRTIDFSSRAHISIDPSLKAYEIKIPKQIFTRLYFIEYLYYLNHKKNINIENLRPYIKNTDSKIDEKYLIYVDEFIEYFFNSGKVNEHQKMVLLNRQPTLKLGVVKSRELLETP